MPANNCRLGKNIQAYNENLINAYDSDIGDGTRIGSFSEIGGAVVGKDCVISAYVFICPACKIGDRVFLGPGTKLLNDLYPSIKGDEFVPNGVIIEDDVIVGGCCTILPGVTIGKGARVGAGAVVTKSVPPNTTVIGFPAQEREDVWQPCDLSAEVALDIRNVTLGPPRPGEKDIYPPSPLAGTQHNIDPTPALSSDHPMYDGVHPYKKYVSRKEVLEKKYKDKEVVEKDESPMFGGSPYTKITFKKEHPCEGECSKSVCDCDGLPPAIDVTEWVGTADEPVFCRELPEGYDWEKAGIPRVTAERLRALIDADEELVLSRTKAHKKHRIPDRLPSVDEPIGLGLGLGYWKDGQPKEKK